MKYHPTNLSASIRIALSVGTLALMATAIPAYAQGAVPQPTSAPPSSVSQRQKEKAKKKKEAQEEAQAETLAKIEVTGSHIPGAELAEANPVITITAAEIKATGALTLGTIISRLPQIMGSLHTPNQDYGGNSGGTYVGLRGLGAERTLVLINGQRIQGESNQNSDGPVDLNTIPAAAVQRIEILTNGASAIYGSAAIGGVINVITYTNYDKAQFSTNAGISSHGDGQTQSDSFIFGQSTARGSFVGALSYNKFDAVTGSARKWSRNILYLSTTSAGARKSVSGAGGNGEPGPYLNVGLLSKSLAAKFGCPSSSSSGQGLALKRSAWRDGTSPTVPSDYRCYTSADNYNAYSLMDIVTPQERVNGYFSGKYKLTSNVTASLTYIANKSRSSALSSFPYYGTNTVNGVAVSQDSYYNPFGVSFSQAIGDSYDVQLPNEFIAATHTSVNYILGRLDGHVDLAGRRWNWAAGMNYSHISQMTQESGIPNNQQLQAGAGPSFMNANGIVQCGSAADPIPLSMCTPWDPFNTNAPSSRAFLRSQNYTATNTNYLLQRNYYVSANGALIGLPAGRLKAAFGAGFTQTYQGGNTDPGLLIDPATGTCLLGGSCTGPATQGGFDDKDAYGQLFIPVFRDTPFAKRLNVILADRYSKDSLVHGTSNTTIGIEYRPVEDLLLRGTVASTFRAPSIADFYRAPLESGNLITSDPCEFIAPTGDPNAPNPNADNPACVNVPKTGSFRDDALKHFGGVNTYIEGAKVAGFPLEPEIGKSFDFGAVYSPPRIPGLTLSADYWRVYVRNIITRISAQTELNLCAAGQLQYCPLIVRETQGDAAGQISRIVTPTVNLGRLDVQGIDLTAHYRLPETALGHFSIHALFTYLKQYKSQSAPGEPGDVVASSAGTMAVEGTAAGSGCPDVSSDGGTCYLPKVEGQATLYWNRGPWSASWEMRLLGGFHISEDPYNVRGLDQYGATVYNYASVSYDAESIHTTFSFGINNIGNRQPPLLYSNRVEEFNTDTDSFNVYGRYYWASAAVTF